MLDCALGASSNNLMPIHRTNLILHLLNTGLVVLLLSVLFGRKWQVLGVGLLFGLAPTAVESLAWICERKTLLSAFFSFSCLIFYILYSRDKKKGWFFFCVASYLLALLSKPISVPLPVLMLLLDFWPLGKLDLKAVLEKVPLFIIGAVFAAITMISQHATVSVQTAIDHNASWGPLVLCHNVIHYLGTIVWPIGLRPHYSFPYPMTLSNPKLLFCTIASCLLIVVLALSLRRTRALLTGWLFFFIAIFPTLGLIGFTFVIAADKYVYLPSVGFLMILTAFLCYVTDKYKSVLIRYILMATILLLASGQAIAVRNYLGNWKDTVTLCESILKDIPNASEIHVTLGHELLKAGKSEKAGEHFRQAIKAKPGNTLAYYNLGAALLLQGKAAESLELFRTAIKYDPYCIKAYNNLGWIMATSPDVGIRDPQQAMKFATQAVEMTKSQNTNLLSTLAAAQASVGQFENAVETAQKAIAMATTRKEVGLINTLNSQLKCYLDQQLYYDPIFSK